MSNADQCGEGVLSGFTRHILGSRDTCGAEHHQRSVKRANTWSYATGHDAPVGHVALVP